MKNFIILMITTLLFCSCMQPGIYLKNEKQIQWKKNQWAIIGNWQLKKEGLIKSFSYEKTNYCLMTKELEQHNRVFLEIDLYAGSELDLGILFGAQPGNKKFCSPPEDSYVLCLRKQDWYFNQRTNGLWGAPTAKTEYPTQIHSRLKLFLELNSKYAQAILYDRVKGKMLQSKKMDLKEFPKGSIGFYSYYTQDPGTIVEDITIRYE